MACRESLSKALESAKTESQTASYRIHALDVEIETAQSKLRAKERSIDVRRERMLVMLLVFLI